MTRGASAAEELENHEGHALQWIGGDVEGPEQLAVGQTDGVELGLEVGGVDHAVGERRPGEEGVRAVVDPALGSGRCVAGADLAVGGREDGQAR